MADLLLISVKDACESLSLGKTKLYELMNDGTLKSGKHGAKRILSFLSVKNYAQKLIGEDQEAAEAAETAPADSAPESAPTAEDAKEEITQAQPAPEPAVGSP